MSRSSTLLVLGALVVITPFSGLPFSWLRIFFVLFGAGVMVVGFLIRSQGVKEARLKTPDAIPDSSPSSPNEISSIA